jgi:hypothetical protein
VLPGPAMVGLVQAVAALASAGLGRYVVVGGVAVSARLGQAHRATADVDTVVDETTPPDAVAALLALPAAVADPTGEHRVVVGGTKVEVIAVGPVADEDVEGLTDLQALFVSAHAWALDTATDLRLVADADPETQATAPFATPAALVAMKLHAIQDRRAAAGRDKRSGDAWDLYRLLTDLDHDGGIRRDLAAGPSPLRTAVRAALETVLVRNATRTKGWLAAGDDQMAAVTADELRYLAGPVIDALLRAEDHG